MDQTFIAGIGNIYSDEILWEAGLRWDRTPALSCRTWRSGGCSARSSRSSTRPSSTGARRWPTSSTSTSLGRPGEYQQFHKVYDRAGQACRRCRAILDQREVRRPQHLLLPRLPGLTLGLQLAALRVLAAQRHDSAARSCQSAGGEVPGGVGAADEFEHILGALGEGPGDVDNRPAERLDPVVALEVAPARVRDGRATRRCALRYRSASRG